MTTLNATMDHMHMGNLASKAEPASKAASTSSRPLAQSDTDSDEKLLLDVGNQSREAFNKLFERFSTKIFAHGMKITRNEQLSKDLVQEAMMTVWQKAPLYNSDRAMSKAGSSHSLETAVLICCESKKDSRCV